MLVVVVVHHVPLDWSSWFARLSGKLTAGTAGRELATNQLGCLTALPDRALSPVGAAIVHLGPLFAGRPAS